MNTISTSRALEFRKALESGAIVADGAMGTMLYDKGVFINRCFDELNISQASTVKEVHDAYVKAGAQILETNTFGGNRIRLAAFGLAEKLIAINQAGVRIARESAKGKDSVFVAGALGPLGIRIEPHGPTTFAEVRDIYREQLQILVEEGVDLLVFETFTRLDELKEALFVAREIAGPEMVIVSQVTIDDHGHMLDGTDTESFT